MRLIVLGAPGAGKGTQARNMAEHFKIPHISTSDVLRGFIGSLADEKLAAEIHETMSTGGLVSDDVIIDLVKSRVSEPDCNSGYIFDGFPRNINQAEHWQEYAGHIDSVIYVYVPDEVIVDRISGRLVCPGCGKMYHIHYFPPAKGRHCDECGCHVIQREDDKTRTVVKRLKLYHSLTSPVIEFYRNQGLLKEFDGSKPVGELTAEIVEALK